MKIKNSVAIFALLMIIGSAFAFSPFKADTPKYQYLSSSKNEVDIENIDNWVLVDDESPDCGSIGTLVCRYAFNGDIHAFQNFLESPETTAKMINENAVSNKR